MRIELQLTNVANPILSDHQKLDVGETAANKEMNREPQVINGCWTWTVYECALYSSADNTRRYQTVVSSQPKPQKGILEESLQLLALHMLI